MRESLHTDRQILQCIFDMYRAAYPGTELSPGKAENDPYLPIDVGAVAARLNCDHRLLFGRLYYSLGRRHRYVDSQGVQVLLFAVEVGGRRHCVNFPLLVAVLAEMRQEHSKYSWTLALAVAAVVVSVLGVALQK